MADVERRPDGPIHGNYNRKRRYRGDDDYDRRSQRRRYEEPSHVKLRKQLSGIAESPLKRSDEEVSSIAKALLDNYEDDLVKSSFVEFSIQLALEQPLKIPFIAAVVLAANQQSAHPAQTVIDAATERLQQYFTLGSWREAKLTLRLLGCLQGILDGAGVFPILEELFSRAVDLQTTSSEDSLGLELVKIILLTLPYVMAMNADASKDQALAILDKTDVIASTPHVLYNLANSRLQGDEEGQESLSFIGQLQKQLSAEAENGWKLACVPRPWNPLEGFNGPDESTPRHKLPDIKLPSPVVAGTRPPIPEIFFSVYTGQEIETVPPVTDIASSLVRDALVDTINMVDFNRHATAKFLIDVDCYFAEEVFVKRATQYDKLRGLEDGKSTWKPEDVAVDAVFSQLFQLPAPEHKLVYYHSVLTEACKIAPAAVAPSLGRAIRRLYNNVEFLDLEVVHRFMDWFSHHLSNFGFTWKWTEWIEDLNKPNVHPKKAFIIGALEKEIRLSFAARIRGTLPEPYRPLISEAQEEDTPPYKFNSDQTPYAEEGRRILHLLKTKAPEAELQGSLTSIQESAAALGLADVLVPSTDAFVTTICYLGSKSLSHTLSQIERYKERLLAIGPQSEAARRQITSSVMEYWCEKPGMAVAVIDKMLNYTILTPQSVIQWALSDQVDKGQSLTKTHIYEIITSTVSKVTGRIRQIVTARNALDLPAEQRALLDETLATERAAMKDLFTLAEDALTGIAEGSNDAMAEGPNQDTEEEELLRTWGQRWLRVFSRRRGVEENWVEESLQQGNKRLVDDGGDKLANTTSGNNGTEEDDSVMKGMDSGQP